MILHRPRTLLWQFGLALMAMQAAVLLLLGWYAWSQFKQFTSEQTSSELRRITPMIARHYGEAIKNFRLPEQAQQIDAIVKGDAAETDIRITIMLPDGRVIADSDADPNQMENHLHRAEVQAALRGEFQTALRESASTHVPTAYFAQLIGTPEQPLAIIRTALPLAVVSEAPARVIRAVGTAAAIFLALTLVAMYLVSRQLSQTVSRMADGAARFASGDLQHRLERPASSELAALAQSFNEMAHQLKDQIDQLRQQRNEQQAIHRSMSNGMIALDRQQRILSVNRAAEQLLGLDGQTSRGKLLAELLREPELNRFVAGALAGDDKISGEFRLRTRVGATLQAVSEPLRDAHDEPVGVLVFITDVTQLRRLESIRSDFAANVSHELRTPITNIKGYVETMMDVGVADQHQTLKFLDIISRNTARLSAIIEDLLSLARLEEPDAKATLERRSISVRRVADSAVAQFESERQTRGTIALVQIPEDLRASANPQLLEQALANLLSNAIRYSPPKTTVVISSRTRDTGEVEIAVTDQGPGIPTEHLDRIFERFYRIDRARSREMGGTGLGLSIVKHIALVHGGRVEVESEIGCGSTFRIVLPRDAAVSGR